MADAQWVLDIAAEMPEGAATIQELDALAERLTGATRRSDDFQAAVKRVTSELDAAKAASAEAAAALAQGSEQYKLLERDAIRTSKALEQAQARGRFDPRAARAAHEAAAALDAYTGKLRGLEATSAAAQAKQAQLARQLANVTKLGAHADARNAALSQRYEKLGAALGRIPGPLGALGSRLVGTAKAGHEARVALGATNLATIALAVGAALAVVAVVALTAALVAGVVAAVRFAVAQADAARNAALSRQAFAALSDETAAAVGAFDDVAAATGLGEAELVALTKQLRAAEVAAADMPKALRAAATAEAALGSGGAAEFIRQIEAGEASVDSFAREVDAKFGGVVAAKLRGLDAQGKRFGKLWAGLFKGINLDPVLDAVEILVGMFDRGNPLAQAFATGIEKAFGVVADNAVEAAYAIEAFALGVAINSLKAYLFFKQNGQKIENALLALGITLGVVGAVWAVFNAGVIAGWAVAAASAVASAATIAASAVASAATIAAAWVVAALPAIAVIAAIVAVGAAIYQLITYWDDVVEGVKLIWSDLTSWFGGLVTQMVDVGRDLLTGLVQGITETVGAVVSAITGAVGSAITAAKDVLGISSPSKVFAEIGTQTAEGYAEGVEDGTPDAQGSLANMVGSDAAASAAGAGPAQGAGSEHGGRSGGAIDLSGATFNFYGVKDAENARDMIADLWTRLLEGDADSLGGAEVPT